MQHGSSGVLARRGRGSGVRGMVNLGPITTGVRPSVWQRHPSGVAGAAAGRRAILTGAMVVPTTFQNCRHRQAAVRGKQQHRKTPAEKYKNPKG